MGLNVRSGSKRKVCGCGRLFNPGSGNYRCCVCEFGRLSGDDDDLGLPRGWSVDELGAVLERADRLRAMGLISEITCRLVRGVRRYVVDGRAFSLEDLDLHLAKLLRVHHEQQAAMAEYAKRRRRIQTMLAMRQASKRKDVTNDTDA